MLSINTINNTSSIKIIKSKFLRLDFKQGNIHNPNQQEVCNCYDDATVLISYWSRLEHLTAIPYLIFVIVVVIIVIVIAAFIQLSISRGLERIMHIEVVDEWSGGPKIRCIERQSSSLEYYFVFDI